MPTNSINRIARLIVAIKDARNAATEVSAQSGHTLANAEQWIERGALCSYSNQDFDIEAALTSALEECRDASPKLIHRMEASAMRQSTANLVKAIEAIAVCDTATRTARAAMIEVYAERQGETDADALMDRIGM